MVTLAVGAARWVVRAGPGRLRLRGRPGAGPFVQHGPFHQLILIESIGERPAAAGWMVRRGECAGGPAGGGRFGDQVTFAVGRGNLRAARLTREQAEENLKSTEADIAVQVAQAIGQIETTRKRVVADRAAYDLDKQVLASDEKMKTVGQISTFQVVNEQQQVLQGENILNNALASERQAVALYDQALGTTLERYHITLTDN